MNVKGIVWAGTRTERRDETVRLMRDVLKLREVKTQEDVVVFDCENGDRVEVFGPKDNEHRFFRGIVAGFEVDDVDAAARELRAAGIRTIGDVRRMAGYTWIHFEGPDGNVWELTQRE